MAPPHYAALDLGTNTFRLLIAKPEPQAPRGYVCVHAERVITRAGGGFSAEAGIGGAALARILTCLHSFQRAMQSCGVAAYRATATSVFRRAPNSAAILETIRRETGLAVEVIDGVEEAELSAQGAVSQIALEGAAVIFDIGGGSTEYIVWDQGAVRARESLEFGVVRLSEDMLHSDPPSEAELKAMADALTPQINAAAARAMAALRGKPFTLVGTAGTVSTLGAIDLGLTVYDRERINGHRLQVATVADNYRSFSALARRDRLAVSGMEPGREDLIVPGCFIAQTTMHALGAASLLVSEGGLLEGVLFDVLNRYAVGRS